MIRRTLFLILLPAIIATGEQASNFTEAKAAFGKADRTLNEAWTAVKKRLPEKIFAELKVKQREWIESRERRALDSSPNPKDPAGAKRSAAYWQTAASQTDERAQWLRRLASKEDDSLTGYWTDGESGSLEIVRQDEKLFFVLHVVRRFNVGFIAGTATWNKKIGWFSDKGREPDKTDETTISFLLQAGHFEVTGVNTSYYHGHHAYFDGDYYKIAPLDAKAEANIIKAGESGNEPER